MTHGELWHHLHLAAVAASGCVFLPLTLERGPWLWVKKNPRQLFSRHGISNPLIEHGQQRVLRRHLALLDFVKRAAVSHRHRHRHRHWLLLGEQCQVLHDQALDRWYRD